MIEQNSVNLWAPFEKNGRADNGFLDCFSLDKPQGIVLRTNTTENAAIEGSSMTFVCSADSVPPSVYELRFKPSLKSDSNNGIFTIQQVKASHQGTYECAVRNILGIGAVATLHLDVLREYGESTNERTIN